MSTLQVNAIVNLNNEAQFGPVLANTTPYTLSGTAVDVTAIPSWVRKIVISFAGLSTNGTSNPLIQLGTAAAFVSTGYLGASSSFPSAAAINGVNYTTGFGMNSGGAANILHGTCTLTLIGTNTWLFSCSIAFSNAATTIISNGSVTLADVLTKIRLTTVNGTDTFDAGTMNVVWE